MDKMLFILCNTKTNKKHIYIYMVDKDAIALSQGMRVIERSSHPGSAVPHLEALKEKFLEIKYPEVLIDKQFKMKKRFNIPGKKTENKVRQNKTNFYSQQWKSSITSMDRTSKTKIVNTQGQRY